ncbi:MAG: hypothetical protein WCT23_06275 [Candidatus Neomarinimicrobiota bacterium]
MIKYKKIQTFLFFLLFSLPLFSGTASEQIIITPPRTIYSLQHALITSDSLFAPEHIKYLLDPTNGRIILLQKPEQTDTITIHYHYSDISVPKSRSLGIGKINEWFPKKIESTKSIRSDNSSIKTRGSVSRKIEVGSAGQSLLSGGLDIRLSGELAPGVNIKGIINDNDAPFQDYSSTQSVKDVDNVLISIYSDKLNASIGDIYVKPEWNYWSRFNRKLIGAQTAYKNDRYQGEAFIGSARGKYIRQEVTAREADQGPYRLYGKDGDNSIQIVPQSEKIYVDGMLLNKSQYTLYYTDAELYFSPDFLVSSTSRILVEFNYVNDFYSRSSLGAMSAWTFGKNLKVSASFIREKDDEKNPLDIHLLNTPADSLANISTENGIFIVSTAMKDTAGDYTKNGDTWLYAGEDQGTHTVYFYRENTNGGYIRQYNAEGKMYFTHAPNDPLSQYFPRRKVTLPNSHWIASMNMELGQKDKAHANIEGAYSGLNENNYDPDHTQSSPAAKWEAALPLGKNFSLLTKGWSMNKNYKAFVTVSHPDIERYFGFSSLDTLVQNAEFKATLKNKFIALNSGLEYLANAKGENRLRMNSKAKANIRGVSLALNHSQLLDNAFLPYYSYEISSKVPLGKSFSMHASFLQDLFEPVFKNSQPYRAEVFKSGVSIGPWAVNYTFRKDYNWQEADTSFQNYSNKHDASLKFDQGFFKNALRWNTSATYRLEELEEANQQYLLTNSQLNLDLKKIGLNTSIKATINRNSETKREAVFIFVGDGLGYYRLDEFGQYVPDEMGNFILSSDITNERQDQYISKLNSSLRWRKQWEKLNLQFLHKASTDYRAEDLQLYTPIKIENPDTALFFANLRLRHELFFSKPDGKHRLSFFREDLRSQNFQTAYNENLSIRTSSLVKYRFKPDKVILNIYYENRDGDRQRMPLGSYRVQTLSNALGLEGEYLFSKALRSSLETKYEHISTNYETEFLTHWYQLKSDWIWYRVSGERMFASATIDLLRSNHTGALPYETASGLPLGFSWSAALRYEKRINEFLSASGFFQYRQRAEQKAILTAKLEVKAYF